MATNIDIDSLPTLREVVNNYTLDDWFGRKGGSRSNRRAFELPCHPKGCVVIELRPFGGIESIDFALGFGHHGCTIRKELTKFPINMTKPGRNFDGERVKYEVGHTEWTPYAYYRKDKNFSIIGEINTKLISILENEGIADDPVSYHSYLDEYWEKIGYEEKPKPKCNSMYDPDDFIPRLI